MTVYSVKAHRYLCSQGTHYIHQLIRMGGRYSKQFVERTTTIGQVVHPTQVRPTVNCHRQQASSQSFIEPQRSREDVTHKHLATLPCSASDKEGLYVM